MALLWIIGCCGIIGDAGLDNGHSLSVSSALEGEEQAQEIQPQEEERLMAYKDEQSWGR